MESEQILSQKTKEDDVAKNKGTENKSKTEIFCQELLLADNLEFSEAFVRFLHYKLIYLQTTSAISLEARKTMADNIAKKFPFVEPQGKISIEEIFDDQLLLEDYCNYLLQGKLPIVKADLKKLHAKLHNTKANDLNLRILHHKLAFKLYQESPFLKKEYPFPNAFFTVASEKNIEKLEPFVEEIWIYWDLICETLESKKEIDRQALVTHPNLSHSIQKRMSQDLYKDNLEFCKYVIEPLTSIIADKKIGLRNYETLTDWLKDDKRKKKPENAYKERRWLQQSLLKHYQNFCKIKTYLTQVATSQNVSHSSFTLVELPVPALQNRTLAILESLTADYYDTNPETGKSYIEANIAQKSNSQTFSAITLALNKEILDHTEIVDSSKVKNTLQADQNDIEQEFTITSSVNQNLLNTKSTLELPEETDEKIPELSCDHS